MSLCPPLFLLIVVSATSHSKLYQAPSYHRHLFASIQTVWQTGVLDFIVYSTGFRTYLHFQVLKVIAELLFVTITLPLVIIRVDYETEIPIFDRVAAF